MIYILNQTLSYAGTVSYSGFVSSKCNVDTTIYAEIQLPIQFYLTRIVLQKMNIKSRRKNIAHDYIALIVLCCCV